MPILRALGFRAAAVERWRAGGVGALSYRDGTGGWGTSRGDTSEERLLARLPEVRLKMGVVSVFALTSPKPLVVYANCPTPQLPQHPDFHPLATTPTAAKGSNLVASQSPWLWPPGGISQPRSPRWTHCPS